MSVLIDTHAVIWFITDDSQLVPESRKIIEDPSNVCMVSIASLWEIGIKNSLGKLELKTDLRHIFEIIEQSGFSLLPITPDHILENAALPYHHRDPFDRLIIAQAMHEGMTVVTKDKEFKKYSVQQMWS